VLEALGRLLKDSTTSSLPDCWQLKLPPGWCSFPGAAKAIEEEKLQWAIVGAGRERMLREICESLKRIRAEKTLLLVLEDFHWSDRSTSTSSRPVARRRRRRD
jgi:hypothetical protein